MTEKEKEAHKQATRNAKYNNYFLMSVFTNLVAENGTNASSVVPSTFLPNILLGRLPKEDADTKIDSQQLGAKIKFLLRELKSGEQAQQFFSNSFFSKLIECFRRGTTSTNTIDRWIAYKPTEACDAKYKEREPFAAALMCYQKNENLPVGINFAKIIDCLIVRKNNGEYAFRQNFDEFGEEATLMTAACDKYLRALKTNPLFTSNFEPVDEKDTNLE